MRYADRRGVTDGPLSPFRFIYIPMFDWLRFNYDVAKFAMLPLSTLFTAHEPIDLRKVNGSFDTSDKITWTFNNRVE